VARGFGQFVQLKSVVGVHDQNIIGPFVITEVSGNKVPVLKVWSAASLMVGFWFTVIFTRWVSVKQW
jgi:hypothetical protein